jgi:IS5 family transposase
MPKRLMVGITVLKCMRDLSDEAVCDRWGVNPYFQFFCGEEFFQHRLVSMPLQISRDMPK